ncbi:hypothetical protein SAMD00019534_000470 [Acytostelium subglobosum LB1]|uniref:hypothetical protein n=1 Tax=Acytostelium subglobosum LB1 TaxID=1410327 RepID=UPI000644B68E|nr:hypothetical protein SAMD00019534_000470 [Acytostelium subglobosum LB1]GAM16872.1 hypothetical protein SAMD00019534_000470 [Acytostelium subglobosum LB1]|eukprot:XP_012758934.1 hypothetical protein SAMD00019534_000470 [Acytostelium subglobosum LB1]
MAIHNSLIEWINTFDNLPSHCNSLDDLADGVLLYELCRQITLVSKDDIGDNWVLRSENINNLLSSLDQYYVNELGLNDQTSTINVETVAKDRNDVEIIKLIELILGVVLECDNKEEYIGKMQILDPTVQNDLMVIIEKIMSNHQQLHVQHVQHNVQQHVQQHVLDNDLQIKEQHNNEKILQLEIQLEQLQRDKSDLRNELSDMSVIVGQAERDKHSWSREREQLQEVCSNLQHSLETSQRSMDELRQQQATNNIMSQVKEELSALQQQIQDKDKQIQDFRKKVEESNKQNRGLKDEVDMLKEKVSNAELTEEKLKKYQQKIEENMELKKRIKSLEENNDNYLNQLLDMEEQVKKASLFKGQLESTKQLLTSLQIDNTKLEMSVKMISDERELLQSTLSRLEMQHTSLQEELESNKKKLDQMEHDQQSKLLETTTHNSFGMDQIIVDPSTKIKTQRLEREISRLQESVERIPELERQLEEAVAIKDELLKQVSSMSNNNNQSTVPAAIDNNDQSKEIIQQLNQTIKELKDKNVEQQHVYSQLQESTESTNTTLKERNLQLDTLSKEVAQLRAEAKLAAEQQAIPTPQPPVLDNESAFKETIASLLLEKERLEGYLRSARKMIKELREKETERDSGNNKIDRQEYIADLENISKLKDDHIKNLTRQIKDGKEASQRELNLMLSSFLRLGSENEALKFKLDAAAASTSNQSSSSSSSALPQQK